MAKTMTMQFILNAAMSGNIGTQLKAAGATMTQLASKTADLRRQIKLLDQAKAAGGIGQASYNGSYARLSADLERATRAQEKLNAASKNYTSAKAKMSNAWAGVGSTAAGIAVAAAPLAGMVNTAANFEAAMSKVQAITNSDTDSMAKLTQQAKDLGASTMFSASQAADAMSYLGLAGWNTEQIMSGMPGLLNLAAASGTDLARAADIVSDDLSAFGYKASDMINGIPAANHLADVFAYTMSHTNTTVEMLGETMKYAAPVATAFGASMEETAAMAGIMANSGVKASQAGTALRAGFIRLAGPPKKSRKAMEELGISFDQAATEAQEAQQALAALGISMDDGAGGQKKMVNIMRELQEKTADLGKEEKLATLSAIFGQEAATGWLNVLEAGPDQLEQLATALDNCDGTAENMAQVMQNNAKGALTQLQSAIEGMSISIGSVLLPPLAKMTRAVAESVGGFASWATANPVIVQTGLAVAGVAAGGLLAVKSFIAVTETISAMRAGVEVLKSMEIATKALGMASSLSSVGGLAGLGPAVAALTPVLPIILAVGAAVAVVYTHWDELCNVAQVVTNKISAYWEAMQGRFGGAFSKIQFTIQRIVNNFPVLQGAWQSVCDFFDGNSSVVSAVFNTMGSAITATVEVVIALLGSGVTQIANIFELAGNTVVNFSQMVGNVLDGDFAGAWENAKSIVGGFGTFAEGTVRNIGDTFNSIIGIFTGQMPGEGLNISTIFGDMSLPTLPEFDLSSIFSDMSLPTLPEFDISTIVSNIAYTVGYVAGAVSQIPTVVQNAIVTAIDYLGQLPTKVYEIGTQFTNAVIEFAANSYTAIVTGLALMPGAVAEMAVSFIAAAQAWLSENYNTVVIWITNTVTSTAETLATLPGACMDAGMAFVAAAESWASEAFNAVQNWISQIPSMVSGYISSAWSSITGAFSSGFGAGADIAHNAQGGIYQKGAFLTTFAEDSAEAAIPLDGSSRAISLWQQAGEMLGMFPQDTIGGEQPLLSTETQRGTLWERLSGVEDGNSVVNNSTNTANNFNTNNFNTSTANNSNATSQNISISIPVTITGNADKSTVTNMQSTIEKLVRQALEDIEYHQRRVSFA